MSQKKKPELKKVDSLQPIIGKILSPPGGSSWAPAGKRKIGLWSKVKLVPRQEKKRARPKENTINVRERNRGLCASALLGKGRVARSDGSSTYGTEKGGRNYRVERTVLGAPGGGGGG